MATKNIEENPLKKTMSDRTRYTIIGVVSVLLLGLIICLAVFNGSNVATSVATKRSESLKDFYEVYDSEEPSVVFFARTGCSWCALEEPILKQIAEDYDMDYYAIDIATLTTDERDEVVERLELGDDWGTPDTVIVQNGKVLAKTGGYVDGKPYVEYLKAYGLLPEDAIYTPEDKLIEIEYDQFIKIAKEKTNSIVYVDQGASGLEARSYLNELATKNGFTINYLSQYSFTQDDIEKFLEEDLKNFGYKEERYVSDGDFYVPVLLVIKNNKILGYVAPDPEENTIDFSAYDKLLKKNGFID